MTAFCCARPAPHISRPNAAGRSEKRPPDHILVGMIHSTGSLVRKTISDQGWEPHFCERLTSVSYLGRFLDVSDEKITKNRRYLTFCFWERRPRKRNALCLLYSWKTWSKLCSRNETRSNQSDKKKRRAYYLYGGCRRVIAPAGYCGHSGRTPVQSRALGFQLHQVGY